MEEFETLAQQLKTLSGKCLLDDIADEYSQGVWTISELKAGLRDTLANAEGEYKQDVQHILNNIIEFVPEVKASI